MPLYYLIPITAHPLKIGILTKPEKRFRRCLKAFKGVKTMLKIYETLKGSPRVSKERIFSYETLF
jgi:hypothetical protein